MPETAACKPIAGKDRDVSLQLGLGDLLDGMVHRRGDGIDRPWRGHGPHNPEHEEGSESRQHRNVQSVPYSVVRNFRLRYGGRGFAARGSRVVVRFDVLVTGNW